MFDLVVVGHFTIDEVILQGEKRTQAGGAALYTSIAAAKMGLKVGVISKVGHDYPKKYLNEIENLGIDLSAVEVLQDTPTTRFILDYTGDERRLSLKGRCKPIRPSDLHDLRTRAMHIAPILEEVPAEVVSGLSKRCEILSLDPQGYVRGMTEGGVVEPKAWFDAEALSHVRVFKSSMRELRWITEVGNPWDAMERVRECGPEVVIATWGRRGALMLVEGDRYHVPAFTTARPIDPTGAGDAFMGGFLSQYLRDRDALWSASVGTALAFLLIETQGCRIEASMEEVYERAYWVQERIEEM